MKKIILTIILLVAFGTINYAQKWEAPAKYKTMKNTVSPKDQASMSVGKDLWAKHCKSCHGSKGIGDGPKSATLKTKMDDFSSVKFQSQTDGEIYYKTFVKGNGEMPTYDKKVMNESDRWAIVNYMKSLKK